MADRVGQQLGDYRLIRSLGTGSYGEVYLGEHLYLQTRVAIKVLYENISQAERQALLAEARLMAQLRHPHIAQVLGYSEHGTTPYLVMQLAPGGTLKDRYPRGTPLPLATILPYVLQAAEGLQYAHDHKRIHLDIKPANMLIGEGGEVLLGDFGIAVALQQEKTHQTLRGLAAGTPEYGAPEQFEDGGHLTAASDQYALATVVYGWLTGSLPFQGATFAVISQKLHAPPLPLRARMPSISPAVERVVLKALSRDPSDRYPTVSAFAEALKQASQDRQVTPVMTSESTLPIQSAVEDQSEILPIPAAGSATDALKPDPQQLSIDHHFGEFKSQHQLRHERLQFNFGILLLIIGILLDFSWITLFSSSNNLLPSLSNVSLACTIGIVLTGLAILLIRTAPEVYSDWLYLYEDGLIHIKGKPVLKDLEGNETGEKSPELEMMRWADIAEVWLQIPPGEQSMPKTHARALKLVGYDFSTQKQRQLTYNKRYNDFEPLVEIVEERLTARKLPEVIAQYHRQEALKFGKITLTTTGISDGARLLHWENVASIAFPNDTLVIKDHNGKAIWYQGNQEGIANFCILKAFFAYLQPTKGYELEPPD